MAFVNKNYNKIFHSGLNYCSFILNFPSVTLIVLPS